MKSLSVRKVIQSVLGVALFVGMGCAVAQPVTLKFLYIPGSTTYIPVLAAVERGFFDAEQIKLELIAGASAAALMTAMATGDVDSTHNSLSYWAALSQQGIDVGTVGAYIYVTRMLVLPIKDTTTPRPGRGSTSWQDTFRGLKGKTIGTLTGAQRTDVVELFKMLGLNAEKDVSLVELGSAAAQVAAIDQGQVDALVTVPPWAYAAISTKKADVVLDLVSQGPREAKGSMLTMTGISKAALSKSPNLLDRFARGLDRGVSYVKNPANLNEIMSIASKYGVKVADANTLAELVKLIQRDVSSTITLPEAESAIKWAVQTGQIKRSMPVDPLVLKGLVK